MELLSKPIWLVHLTCMFLLGVSLVDQTLDSLDAPDRQMFTFAVGNCKSISSVYHFCVVIGC